MRRIKKPSL